MAVDSLKPVLPPAAPVTPPAKKPDSDAGKAPPKSDDEAAVVSLSDNARDAKPSGTEIQSGDEKR